ncbi:MAG: hypothetical protein IJ246_05370 [Clostridia bacterium]|nr:hypothetical protein [Clostridia bacterium]
MAKKIAVGTGLTAYSAYVKEGGTLSYAEWTQVMVKAGIYAENAYQSELEAKEAKNAAEDAKAAAQIAQQTAESQAKAAADSAEASETSAQNSADSAATAGNARDVAIDAKDQAIDAKTGAEEALQSAEEAADRAEATAEHVDEVVPQIAQAGAAQITAIETKGAETRASIPSDYTTLSDDVTSLKNEMDEVEKVISESYGEIKRYGASGWSNDNPALTRLYDAVGLSVDVGTDATDPADYHNDFDSIGLFARKKCVGHWELASTGDRAKFVVEAYEGDPDYTEDGTMGDYVAVECRPAYVYDDGDTRVVSSTKLPGYRPFACLETERGSGICRPYTYLPCYALTLDGNGNAVSLPGYANRQGAYAQLLADAKKYANASIKAYAMMEPSDVNYYEETLFGIEYANHIEQNIIQGACNLRHTGTDRATVYDPTHFLVTPYNASRAVGSYVSINAAADSDYAPANYPTHKIVGAVRCNASGVPDDNGTYHMIEVELIDASKSYESGVEYQIVSRAFISGSTGDVKVPTGSPVSNTDGLHPMKYRHRENVYGNQWRTSMDLFNIRVPVDGSDEQFTLDWYYMPDPEKWQSGNPNAANITTGDAFVKLAYSTPQDYYRSGYQTAQEIGDPRYPDIKIPVVGTGGSAGKFNGAYAYLVSSHVYRSVRRGGHESNGSYDGFGAVTGAYYPSHGTANYGAGLFFKQ